MSWCRFWMFAPITLEARLGHMTQGGSLSLGKHPPPLGPFTLAVTLREKFQNLFTLNQNLVLDHSLKTGPGPDLRTAFSEACRAASCSFMIMSGLVRSGEMWKYVCEFWYYVQRCRRNNKFNLLHRASCEFLWDVHQRTSQSSCDRCPTPNSCNWSRPDLGNVRQPGPHMALWLTLIGPREVNWKWQNKCFFSYFFMHIVKPHCFFFFWSSGGIGLLSRDEFSPQKCPLMLKKETKLAS